MPDFFSCHVFRVGSPPRSVSPDIGRLDIIDEISSHFFTFDWKMIQENHILIIKESNRIKKLKKTQSEQQYYIIPNNKNQIKKLNHYKKSRYRSKQYLYKRQIRTNRFKKMNNRFVSKKKRMRKIMKRG